LRVHNRKRMFPSFSVTIAGAAGPAARAARSSAASGGPARRILDRPVYLPHIPRHGSMTEQVELCFPARGRYSQEGFEVSTRFPFSLLRKSCRIAARQEVLVLPDIEPTEEFYEILPLIRGELESFFKGRGHDLYAIRDYQEGDSARHLDWKASAKALQLKVREFTREDERRVTLVFDAELAGNAGGISRALRRPKNGPEGHESSLAQFEKAVHFCACLAWHFYEIDAQMRFVTQGLETPMARAAAVVYRALEALALVEPQWPGEREGAGPDEGRESISSALLAQLAGREPGFNIIVTGRPRGSIPTSLWESSYMVFADSL